MSYLLDVIGHDTAMASNFCSHDYWMWENQIAKPKLEALGYSNISFRDGERDSFGPLSRIVRVHKNNSETEFWYG